MNMFTSVIDNWYNLDLRNSTPIGERNGALFSSNMKYCSSKTWPNLLFTYISNT